MFGLRVYVPTIVNKYVMAPALVGKRHLKILPWNLGYVPQRSTFLMITIFVVLNVAFNFFNFPSFTNDTWYLSSGSLYISNLSNRLAVLAIANLALATMLSGRSSILMYLTGCSRTTILAYHRWAGRIAVIKGVAHGAIYLGQTNAYGVGVFTSAGALHYFGCDGLYWNFGIASLAIFAAILVFSLAPVRIPWYEAFLVGHVVLVVAVLITLWYHITLRFHGQYGYEIWLYIAFAFWGFDRLTRVIHIARLNYSALFSDYPAAEIELLPEQDLVRLTMYPSKQWVVLPGQYCFVYFPTLTYLWESHPFSIASWSTEDTVGAAEPSLSSVNQTDGQALESQKSSDAFPGLPEKSIVRHDAHSRASVSFIIRPCDGITKRLRARLSAEQPKTTILALIEGPYGFPSADVLTSDTILAFAGGSGITGILGYLHHYIIQSTSSRGWHGHKGRHPRKFIVYWLVRSRIEADAIVPCLPPRMKLEELGIQLRILCATEREDKIDFAAEIEREQCQGARGTVLSVLTCAPPAISDDIRVTVLLRRSRGFRARWSEYQR